MIFFLLPCSCYRTLLGLLVLRAASVDQQRCVPVHACVVALRWSHAWDSPRVADDAHVLAGLVQQLRELVLELLQRFRQQIRHDDRCVREIFVQQITMRDCDQILQLVRFNGLVETSDQILFDLDSARLGAETLGCLDAYPAIATAQVDQYL